MLVPYVLGPWQPAPTSILVPYVPGNLQWPQFYVHTSLSLATCNDMNLGMGWRLGWSKRFSPEARAGAGGPSKLINCKAMITKPWTSNQGYPCLQVLLHPCCFTCRAFLRSVNWSIIIPINPWHPLVLKEQHVWRKGTDEKCLENKWYNCPGAVRHFIVLGFDVDHQFWMWH
jgi:hypothetical protein